MKKKDEKAGSKRKRSEAADDSENETSEPDDTAHREDLNALEEKDPEFFKYLKENDAEVLDFADDDLGGIVLSEDEEEPAAKGKSSSKSNANARVEVDVTIPLVSRWKASLEEKHSLRALKEVVLAFRAAAHANDEEGKEFKYSVSSPEAYHELLVVALKYVPDVLAHHIPVKETASGKVRVPTDSKKYRTLTPLLNSHAGALCHLLEGLSDASTIKLTLASLLPLLPYFLSFKKSIKNIVKAIITIWSDTSSTDATRINAFLLIRRLAVISDVSLREAVLKTTYQGLVRGSRNTTGHTLAGINLMKNSAAELWGLDTTTGYTTGFTHIRQLAVHLRTSITQPSKEAHKTIYNWQYVHSLDFWSRVLSIHCGFSARVSATTSRSKSKSTQSSSSPLHPLIYPPRPSHARSSPSAPITNLLPSPLPPHPFATAFITSNPDLHSTGSSSPRRAQCAHSTSVTDGPLHRCSSRFPRPHPSSARPPRYPRLPGRRRHPGRRTAGRVLRRLGQEHCLPRTRHSTARAPETLAERSVVVVGPACRRSRVRCQWQERRGHERSCWHGQPQCQGVWSRRTRGPEDRGQCPVRGGTAPRCHLCARKPHRGGRVPP